MTEPLQKDLDYLAHYGVKGMKWGVRNKRTIEERSAPSTVKVNSKASRTGAQDIKVKAKAGKGVVNTKGGKRNVASDDAIAVKASRQKAKASTTDALSNAELKKVTERMELERKFRNLKKDEPLMKRGLEKVADLLQEFGPELIKAT